MKFIKYIPIIGLFYCFVKHYQSCQACIRGNASIDKTWVYFEDYHIALLSTIIFIAFLLAVFIK